MQNPANLKVTTPTDREIRMTRVFDAPRELVFDAMTKPELLKRWFVGPPGWSLEVCEIDLRSWRRLSLCVARARRNDDGHGRRPSRDRASGADRLHSALR